MEFNRKEKELTLTADGEPQLETVKQVIIGKFIKRGVDPKCMDTEAKIEQATHKTVRQKVKLKEGIDKETAKKIQKAIKDLKLKVTASIQGEALRVSAAKKDDLQAVIAYVKANPDGGAERQEVSMSRISFSDTLHWMRHARPGDTLPRLIVNPLRPDRIEPRCKKRRPKQYDLMNKPRETLRKALQKQVKVV